jgi:type VI secretion system protein ImpE
MAQADELLREGDLAGARASLVGLVRASPDDQGARMFLFELLCVCGEWDKALAQLRAVAQLSPEAAMLATVYGQVIAAERVRADAYAGRAPFTVLSPSSDWVGGLAEGLGALAAGRRAEGEALRDAAFAAAGETPGRIGEQPFTWIADADPRLGPCLEAIVAGRWGLIPFEAVSGLKTEGPGNLRDLVWLPVEIALRSGQSAAALLPARYPGSESIDTPLLALGRATEWRDGPMGEVPLGQRLWMLNSGEEVGLLDVRRLDMA